MRIINIQKLLVIVYPNIANLLIAGDRDRDPFKNTTSPYSIMKIRYNLILLCTTVMIDYTNCQR